MKKPPAGLGGLSALSGWVLTVYLHKYLSPSYAVCLCDSLYLFIFPPAARLAACCSPRYARADATTPGHCAMPCPGCTPSLAHPLLLPCGTSLEIKCLTHWVLFCPSCQDKIKLNPPFRTSAAVPGWGEQGFPWDRSPSSYCREG